jgi:hypothetical protein
MTVEQLITALRQYPPDRRVVVPGQEFGLSDVGDVASRRLAFSFCGDEAMGNWIPHLLRRADMHRERCIVLAARPSTTVRPRVRDLGERRRYALRAGLRAGNRITAEDLITEWRRIT